MLVHGGCVGDASPPQNPSPFLRFLYFFLSLPVPQERTFEHEIKTGDKLGQSGQSRSPTGMKPGLVTAWKERKGRPWWPLLPPLLRDS